MVKNKRIISVFLLCLFLIGGYIFYGYSHVKINGTSVSIYTDDLRINGKLDDYEVLNKFKRLKSLNIMRDLTLDDIDFLNSMNDLEYLYLNVKSVDDLTPISNCDKLIILKLININSDDLSFLGNLYSLESLEISGDMDADISALASLTNLKWLDISLFPIKDISAITQLKNLRTAFIRVTQIKSLPDLSDMDNLTYLNVSYNNGLESISKIGAPPMLDAIDISNTNVDNIDALLNVSSLESVTVDKGVFGDEVIEKFRENNIEVEHYDDGVNGGSDHD